MASGWSLDLSKYAQDTIAKTVLVSRKIALEVFRRVIFRTPVGYPPIWETPYKPKGYVGGRARGNWFTTVGGPSSAVTDNADATGSRATNEARAVTATWQPVQGSIFLTNNLPYIGVLENGRIGNKGSKQAPNGMVSITLAEFGSITEQAAQS